MTTSQTDGGRTRRASAKRHRGIVLALLVATASGCALAPTGLRAERAALAEARAELGRGPDPAGLPAPASGDDWRTLLRRALVANGDVRAAWFEWKAAVERVRGASGWPNTNLGLGYSYLFSDQNVKTFDRMTFNAGVDTMENLQWPGKAMAAGRAALAEARVAGERFRAEKFRVQREVLDAWLDLALAAETARLAREGSALAAVGADVADATLEAGGEQGPALAARIASARREDAEAVAGATLDAARARLAALVAIGDSSSIPSPTRLPRPRVLPPDDVLVAAAGDGPAVRGLAAERRARGEDVDLAGMQWIPDVNPAVSVTGGAAQMVGAMIMLPTTIAEIRSGIAVARAMRGAATSRHVQSRRTERAEVEAAIVLARNAERARRLLEERILPAAETTAAVAASAYTTGRGDLARLIEAESLVVETRIEIAAAAVEREKRVAAIEEVLGADLETFEGATAMRVAALPRREEEQQ